MRRPGGSRTITGVHPRNLLPYAETPVVALRQLVGDVLVVWWCVYWYGKADDVRQRVLGLQGAGRQAEQAGQGISDRLRSAADSIAGVPFAGDPLASPLRSAAGAADQLTSAGRSAQQAVATTATVLHAVMVVVLVVLVALWWLRRRARWTWTAGTARQLRRSAGGLQVLGLRGAAHLPLGVLAAVVQPRGAVSARAVGPEVLAELGEAELRRLGLRSRGTRRWTRP